MIDLSRMQCPVCSNSLSQDTRDQLRCSSCPQIYPIIDGVPALKVDVQLDTALDLDQYELDHPVDLDRRLKTFVPYGEAMQKYGINGGACLEIGSGTGNLTAGLVQQSAFTEVHCSDISPKFLNRLRAVLSDDKKLRYSLFDASALPFKSDSMDAIFGHSVLHHILDYEGALKDIFRVLRPGGLAMFGEPIMDSHALTSFCAAIILQFETRNPVASFSKEELNALHAMRKGSAVNGQKMRERRQDLASMEDKHLYVINDMHKLTREIGFREFEYKNAATVEKIGHDHKWRMMNILKRYGGTTDKLKQYDFIFSELSETYGAAMGSAAPFNFGYFILQK